MICLDDLRTLGSHYMCDFAQGKCNWTASAGKMKWIEAQVREYFSLCYIKMKLL